MAVLKAVSKHVLSSKLSGRCAQGKHALCNGIRYGMAAGTMEQIHSLCGCNCGCEVQGECCE